MNEFLTNDMLEEDFLNIFSAFRFLQMILGSCRVDTQQRFVTAPSAGQRLYTGVLATLSSFHAVSTMLIYVYVDRFNDHPNFYKTCIVIMTLHLITYISNLIHVRFLNNQMNIKLYLEMQQVDKVMKIEKIKGLNKKYQRINNGTASFLMTLLVSLTLAALGGGPYLLLGFCGFMVSHSSFVLEMAFCSNLLIFFTLRTQFLNAIMANHIVRVISYTKTDMTSAFMRRIALRTHDFVSCDADVYLRKIFVCFSLYEQNYAYQIYGSLKRILPKLIMGVTLQVLFGFTEIFYRKYMLSINKIFLFFFVNIAYILLGFLFIIQCLHQNLLIPWEWILFFSLQVISVAQWLFITYRCETFYREVRETKQLAVTIMSVHFDGPLRTKAKQILNMIKERSPRFSVYSMWSIDARLLFKLLHLIALCMVNILQLVDIQKSTLMASYSLMNATNFLS